VGDPPSTDPPEEITKYIVDKAPDGITPLNVNFGGKVTLLGAQIDPGLEVAAGKRVKLTMYWRADKALEDREWKLFTHVLDGAGDRLMNIDNVGPLRHLKQNTQTWAPGSWAPGKVYVDTQTFTMPRKVKTEKVQIVVGIWKGRDRLPIESGPSIGENRALVGTLTVTDGGKAKNTRVPRLEVSQLKKGASIRIDGKLDDAPWSLAGDTGPFVNVRTGDADGEFPVQGSAKLLWDEKSLYIGFDVKDQDVVGRFDKAEKDPHLWTKDCVEIMIDPDPSGDNKDYYEIQINPQNLVFDSQFDEYNQPRQEPDGPFGHQDWSAKLESAVQVRGTLNDEKDKDEGYVVEVRIPWSSFDKVKDLPPPPGALWRMNLYAMQNNDGLAWSPILEQGNFHKASRFGRVAFVLEPTPAVQGDAHSVASGSAATAPPGLSVTRRALQQAPSAPKAPPAAAPAASPEPAPAASPAARIPEPPPAVPAAPPAPAGE
jgi:hypothetical protein